MATRGCCLPQTHPVVECTFGAVTRYNQHMETHSKSGPEHQPCCCLCVFPQTAIIKSTPGCRQIFERKYRCLWHAAQFYWCVSVCECGCFCLCVNMCVCMCACCGGLLLKRLHKHVCSRKQSTVCKLY